MRESLPNEQWGTLLNEEEEAAEESLFLDGQRLYNELARIFLGELKGVFTNELERVSLDEPKRSFIYLEKVLIDELESLSRRADDRRVYIAVIKTGS